MSSSMPSAFLEVDGVADGGRVANGHDAHQRGPRNAHRHRDDDGETYKLLLLSESEDSSDVPDLNLVPPQQHLPTAQRIKRKIRAKRRDRDQRASGGLLGVASGAGRSGVSGAGDHAADLAHAFSGCTCRATCMGSAVAALLLAILVLAYFTASLHVQTSKMSLELESVVEDRNLIKDRYESAHVVLHDVLSNQTQLKANFSSMQQILVDLTSQVQLVNNSLQSVAKSLKAAPELKNVPNDVEELKNQFAKFGSRLTELESKINGAAERGNSGSKTLTMRDATSEADTTQQLRLDLSELDTRMTQVAKELAQQLQNEQTRIEQGWIFMGSLQDSIQSVNSTVTALQKTCSQSQSDVSNLSKDLENAAATTQSV